MVILGIDPGIAKTGFGVIQADGEEVKSLEYGCIRTGTEDTKPDRLCVIFDEVSRVIKEHRPNLMAVELLFFNRNTKTALTVGEARGIILLAAGKFNIPVVEYTPLQVKECLAGFGRAKKDQVKEVVKIDLNLESEKIPIDASDALAIALCHHYLEGLE